MSPTSVAGGLDPNSVSPGLLGFIIVVIIGIATWFLARSMTKQLRKLDADHAEKQEPEQQTEHDPGNGQSVPHDAAPNGAH